ncbi:LpqB family beta-propeller domain-containing protein [Hydrogenophaga pseudoflava]|uniref:LpqB family beta-propeller domain-containing protein n=1 Tax=Hydrogenophaga pseudoflava TaxID=47421 RepID=UPI0027E5475E|nr:LpqB family beta-propeller domain-containing protein [Hydrogenophaga pseudoflava]MDQ7746915.1 LpqB family beta-propeller domain-containing protein [Hydrogenophaga pseudoflava]
MTVIEPDAATAATASPLEAVRLPVVYGPGVASALAELGRTEDVHLSPDNRRLAIAGHLCNRVLVLGIDIVWGGDAPQVRLHSPQPLVSREFAYPHGLCWSSDDTLLVANRQGGVPVFRIPPPAVDAAPCELQPLVRLEAAQPGLVETPGSVSVRPLSCGCLDVLVCNNFTHQVTQHLVDPDGASPRAVAGSPLLARGLDIPDGVAHSPDGRWIAVSNHNEQCVRLYDASRALGPDAEPDARLPGADYPHGLRFAAASRRLLVADAGAPFVHVYSCPDGRWQDGGWEHRRLRVLDEDTFLQGRSNPQEGGPKGLDLDRQGRLLIITNEQVPLAFFDLRPLLGPLSDGGGADSQQKADRAVRDAQVWRRQIQGLALQLERKQGQLQVETARAGAGAVDLARKDALLAQQEDRLRHAERALDEARAALRDSQQGMTALTSSRSWRLMAPYRGAGRWLRGWLPNSKV